MRWPWIHRRKLASLTRKLTEAAGRERALELQVAEARGALKESQDAHRRSERERIDLQTSLLRVGFGYAPFPEPVAPEAQAAPAPAAEEPQAPAITPNMNPEDVRRVFVQEAVAKYGTNVRLISRHVEHRLAEYYEYRSRPAIVTQAEQDAARRVQQDVEDAIREGLAAAEVGEA